MYVYNEELGIMEYEEVSVENTQSNVSSTDGVVNVEVAGTDADSVFLSGVDVDNVVALDSSAVVPLAVNGLVTDVSNVLVYAADVTGYGQCYLVFRADYESSLTILDGQLLNFGSDNITGAIYTSDNLNVSALDNMLITVLGRTASNYASNYYKYGGENYVTTYALNNYGSVSGTSEYVQVSNVEQITYSNNYWFNAFLLIAFGILAFNGLRRLLSIN